MTICMIRQVKCNNADESIAMEDKWKELPHMQVLLPLTISLGLSIKRGLGGRDVTSFYSLEKKNVICALSEREAGDKCWGWGCGVMQDYNT